MQLLYNSYYGAHVCSPVAIFKCVPLQCPLSIQEGCPWPKRKPPETETQRIMFVGSFLLEASLTVKNQSLGPMQFLPTQHLCLPPSPRRVPFTILFATLISHVSNPPVNMWPNAKPDTVNFFSGVAPSCICTLVWRLRQWGTWVGGQGIQGLCLWKQFLLPSLFRHRQRSRWFDFWMFLMELQAVPDDAPLHYSVIRDWEEPRCDGKLLKVVTPTDEMTGSFATIIFWAFTSFYLCWPLTPQAAPV